MNDLEICIRIAEIEGIGYHVSECREHVMILEQSNP